MRSTAPLSSFFACDLTLVISFNTSFQLGIGRPTLSDGVLVRSVRSHGINDLEKRPLFKASCAKGQNPPGRGCLADKPLVVPFESTHHLVSRHLPIGHTEQLRSGSVQMIIVWARPYQMASPVARCRPSSRDRSTGSPAEELLSPAHVERQGLHPGATLTACPSLRKSGQVFVPLRRQWAGLLDRAIGRSRRSVPYPGGYD